MVALGNGGNVAVRPRIHWGAILAGVAAGIVTYIVLSVLGLAVGLLSAQGVNPDLGGIAIGTVIYMAISMAVAAFLAGLTTARAAAFLTPAQGRFNGLLTGMLLLAITTLFATNLLTRGLNTALGLAGSAVSAAGAAANNAGGVQGAANSLGLGDQYQAIVGGLNEEELSELIAAADPDLSEAQVRAAAATVGNVVRQAGRNISGNLSNLSNLGDVVNRQVASVEQALTGPQFVQRLQARGLSQAQATEVATVVRERYEEVRTQTAETAEAVARTAADVAARAAWIWLLIAGVVLGFAAWGGGRGGELEPVETVETTRVERTTTDRP